MSNRIVRFAALFAVLAAAAALSAPKVFADANPTPRPGFSIGGRAGYAWPKGTGAGEGNYTGGAQVRAYLWKAFAVEGSADYRQQMSGPTGARTTTDIFPVQVSGLLYLLPDSPVAPFILGGVGWYYTHVKAPGGFDETQNRMGSHVGGGIQFFLSRHWSVDATYRYIFTDRIRTRANGADVSVSGDAQQVTGGLNFHF
jgi:opacity protein-like surface antigen